MFRIENFVMLVVVFAMVQGQDAPYLRSFAKGSSYTFPCDSDDARQKGNLFHCNDELCLDGNVDVCDSVVNCPNFADENAETCAGQWEAHCAKVSKPENGKPFGVATCTNGMCITECDVCDGQYLDCSDFSDETNCSDQPRPDPERCSSYIRRKRAIREPDF